MGSREQNTEKSIFREIGGMALYLTAILVVSYLVLHYVGQRTTVSGMSMYPALEDGDNLLVDKLTYRFRDPERFDIIVFPFRFQEETYYIKRIIGLPGETVQIADGCVFIDGVRLADDLDVEIENPGLAAVPLAEQGLMESAKTEEGNGKKKYFGNSAGIFEDMGSIQSG